MELSIRESIESDLEFFFYIQADEQASYMAAFTPKNPHDKEAYLYKWRKLMKDDAINMQTILLANEVVGYVVKYITKGDAEITYAIDKKHWGNGFTTEAVRRFLEEEQNRPIYGRVAYDNFSSQRVLEKVGFERIGKKIGFANARGEDIEEYIYKLDK